MTNTIKKKMGLTKLIKKNKIEKEEIKEYPMYLSKTDAGYLRAKLIRCYSSNPMCNKYIDKLDLILNDPD